MNTSGPGSVLRSYQTKARDTDISYRREKLTNHHSWMVYDAHVLCDGLSTVRKPLECTATVTRLIPSSVQTARIMFADPADEPTPEVEELYSLVFYLSSVGLNLIENVYRSWALTILCFLLILSLWTSYYVQIKRIRTVHETVLSIFAGMFVGMIVWASPGHLIRDMLVSINYAQWHPKAEIECITEIQTYPVLQPTTTTNHSQLWFRVETGST